MLLAYLQLFLPRSNFSKQKSEKLAVISQSTNITSTFSIVLHDTTVSKLATLYYDFYKRKAKKAKNILNKKVLAATSLAAPSAL